MEEKFQKNIFENPFFKDDLYDCKTLTKMQKDLIWGLMGNFSNKELTLIVEDKPHILVTIKDIAFIISASRYYASRNLKILSDSKLIKSRRLSSGPMGKIAVFLDERKIKEVVYKGADIDSQYTPKERRPTTRSHIIKIHEIVANQEVLLRKLLKLQESMLNQIEHATQEKPETI